MRIQTMHTTKQTEMPSSVSKRNKKFHTNCFWNIANQEKEIITELNKRTVQMESKKSFKVMREDNYNIDSLSTIHSFSLLILPVPASIVVSELNKEFSKHV